MVVAALRDVTGRGDGPGSGGKYHILGATPMSVCGVLLAEFTEADATTVPDYMRCQRPACRKEWPATPKPVEEEEPYESFAASQGANFDAPFEGEEEEKP